MVVFTCQEYRSIGRWRQPTLMQQLTTNSPRFINNVIIFIVTICPWSLFVYTTGVPWGRSSTPADSDAAVNDNTTHASSVTSSSSSSLPSSSDHSVVTPSLVSAVCSLLYNLLALAPQDVSAAIRQHGTLHALMQSVSAPFCLFS